MSARLALAVGGRRPIGVRPTLLVAIAVLLLAGPVADHRTLALSCYQCGQYNEGVGSITPCLIYSEPLDKEHLKSCPRGNDQFCIVSGNRN